MPELANARIKFKVDRGLLFLKLCWHNGPGVHAAVALRDTYRLLIGFRSSIHLCFPSLISYVL